MQAEPLRHPAAPVPVVKTRPQGTPVDETISNKTTHVREPAEVQEIAAKALARDVPESGDAARLTRAKELISSFEEELKQNPKPQRAGRLHFECARLFEAPLAEFAKAAQHYQKACALLPDHIPSLQGARRVLLAQEDFAQAVPLFDAEIKVSKDPGKRALLFYEKGKVLDDSLNQRREAREAFEAALELDHGNAGLLKAVERAELAARAWDHLDRTFERAASAIGSDTRHRAAVVAERARIAEARKHNSAAATELYQSALDTDARAAGAINALKRLHYAHHRWRDLVGVLEREADQVSDPQVRAMALYRVGRTYHDRLGSVDLAISALERALAVAPQEPLVLEELARLYELSKNYPALTGVLDRLAEQSALPHQKVAYLHRAAQIFEDRLKDDQAAVSWYERTLACDRAYIPALQALSKLYARVEKWDSLLGIHNGEAETALDPARRAAAHARIAEILELRLKKPEVAVQHHAKALGIVPGYAPSFKALVRLYTQAGKFNELLEIYERAVDGAADAETKITYLFKIGSLYEDRLAQALAAFTAYKRILDIDAHHLGAIHAAQRAAERGGLWKELISVLEVEAQKVTDKKQKLMLLHRAGEVAEHELADDEAALAQYKKVVEFDKTYAPGLSSLGRLYYKAGRWEELIDVYQSEIRLMQRGPAAAALLHKIGELYDERVGRDEDAIQSFRRAAEMDPTHTPSLHALARKLGERGRWEELVKLLDLELSGLKEPAQIARAAFRLGEVHENRLLQADKALIAYERSLLADPDFRPARDGRVRLLTEAKDWKRLVEELGREATSSKDPQLAIAALLRAGEVWRDELAAAPKAVECFEAVLERDPAHLDALLALEALYAERSSWEQLAKIYSVEARVLTDAGARTAALRELARLQENKEVSGPEQLRQTYFAILQLVPTDLGALLALERIALREKDHKLLAHIDAKLGAASEEPGVIATHHTRLAETLEALGDVGALEVYRTALQRDPESIAAARGITRLAERTGDFSLLEEAARYEARVSQDLSAMARLLVRAANARADKGDVDGAVRVLAQAVEQNPDHEAAAARLRELLLARGDVEGLLKALTQAANSARVPERIAGLWILIAELYAERKNDLPAGLSALHRAQNLIPGHIPTLMKLSELYIRDKQWAEAVDRLNQVMRQTPSEDVKVEANLRLAGILDEHLGDPQRALASLNTVLGADQNNRSALERLVMLQLRGGQTDLAAETAARLVRVSPELGQRVTALSLVGRIERKRGQLAAALQAYEQAVALIGVEGNAASEFRDLLTEQGRRGETPSYERYVAALSRFAEQSRAPGSALAAVYLELTRVLGDDLNQPDKALQALQKGLSATSDHPDLHAELAQRLLRARKYADAIVAFRRALDKDVMRPDAWRGMAEAFNGLQRMTEATLALAPLLATNQANDLERASLSARIPRTAAATPGSFDVSEFDAIDANAAGDPATRLLALLSEGLDKVHAPDLERYGLSQRDRVSAKSGNPLRILTDRIAAIFGIDDYELYIHRAHGGAVESDFTDPPALLMPAAITNLTETQQVFAIARVMANIARRLNAVDRLSAEDIELLFAAAARTVDTSFDAGSADEDFLQGLTRRVSRSLPWLGRGAIEDAARSYAEGSRYDIVDWTLRTKLTGARAALIIADDLPGVIALIRRTEGDLSGAQGTVLSHGTRTVQDLIGFWMSEPALALRRRLGLL